MVAWVKVLLEMLVFAVAVQFNKDRLNRWLMGVFRDVGRVKAYRRRHGDNSMALMTVLRKQEDPLLGVDLWDEEPDHDVPTYTLDELWEFGRSTSQDGDTDDDDEMNHTLLLSIFGRVYDVSAGRNFYGASARYHMFPGHDVTYALSTGCKKDECLTKTAQELSDKELLEGKRWLSFFQLHDKYPYVGKLEDNPMEDLMEAWVEEAIAKQNDGEEAVLPSIF
jgi:membrane-associated progesterone receptor component